AHRFQTGYRLLRGLARLDRLDEVRKEAEALVRRGPQDQQSVRATFAGLGRDREAEAAAALPAAPRAAAPGGPQGPVREGRGGDPQGSTRPGGRAAALGPGAAAAGAGA